MEVKIPKWVVVGVICTFLGGYILTWIGETVTVALDVNIRTLPGNMVICFFLWREWYLRRQEKEAIQESTTAPQDELVVQTVTPPVQTGVHPVVSPHVIQQPQQGVQTAQPVQNP